MEIELDSVGEIEHKSEGVFDGVYSEVSFPGEFQDTGPSAHHRDL